MHIQISTKYRKPQIENEQLDAGWKILICFDDFPNETSIDRGFSSRVWLGDIESQYKSPLVYPMIFPFYHHDCHWNPKDPIKNHMDISWFTSFFQRWNPMEITRFSHGFPVKNADPLCAGLGLRRRWQRLARTKRQPGSASVWSFKKKGTSHQQDMEIPSGKLT